MSATEPASSTRPYLIRALYEWCSDNGFTPYIAVRADDSVQVPREYVQGGEIVLNISFDATSGLKLGNEYIEFKARFAGIQREIFIPVDRVMAIYARENGQGMAFPPPPSADEANLPSAADQTRQAGPATPPPGSAERTPPRPVQLVSSENPKPPASDDEEGDAPPPPPGGGQRPTLKRIK
ncbi:MAG: ClpXP protease specificity-enhancing factor [Comamonadaceae bacterium]|nr:ClpXP protease specificity-enhancing factor [Comamonadaceae bacterium]